MEDAMMNELVRLARQRGIKTIRGYYYPTAKNGMVKDFFVNEGFTRIEDTEKQNVDELQVDCYTERDIYMQVEDRI